MANVDLTVQGMTCNHCVMTVTKALKNVPGVEDAYVSLEEGTAHVTYDAGTSTVDAMREAIVEAGYEVA